MEMQAQAALAVDPKRGPGYVPQTEGESDNQGADEVSEDLEDPEEDEEDVELEDIDEEETEEEEEEDTP
jgi:hypothetical protein